MAAPAPVQLQRPVTVSDLVCCVLVYGTATVGEVMHGVPSDVPTSGLSHRSKENRSRQ